MISKLTEEKAVETETEEYTVYSLRWVMLAMFVLYSASNAFQWTQLVIITSILEKYYGVTTLAVYWTSMIYMVLYIPLIFPASWLLDKKVRAARFSENSEFNKIGFLEPVICTGGWGPGEVRILRWTDQTDFPLKYCITEISTEILGQNTNVKHKIVNHFRLGKVSDIVNSESQLMCYTKSLLAFIFHKISTRSK